jgi:hypothetical protein
MPRPYWLHEPSLFGCCCRFAAWSRRRTVAAAALLAWSRRSSDAAAALTA